MLGDVLKSLRKSRNLKQKELAEAIFVSPSAISQYENEVVSPSRDNLEALANYFNVSTDYLLGTSPNMDLEERMNSIYYEDITVSELLNKCMNLPREKRETLLRVIDWGLGACNQKE